MKSCKKFLACLLCVIMLMTVLPFSFFSSAETYTINGKQLYPEMFSDPGQDECWAYANSIYNYIWGYSFDSTFLGNETNLNTLRVLPDSRLKLTPENLKKYVLASVEGAVLRICNSEYLHGYDGWGHSVIIVTKDQNGFTAIERSNKRQDKYYTWESFCEAYTYSYIKYIKWPNSPEYITSELIEFGSYPQSLVTDEAIIESLNKQQKNWASYEYFADYTSKDFMKYTDLVWNGEKYRGVYFSEYRPKSSLYKCSEENSYQDDNGYFTNTIYWFKWEPIKWKVLDSNGLSISNLIIDSQPYCNYLIYRSMSNGYLNETGAYASDYVTSNIRNFLLYEFYNIAFTSSEKKKIIKAENLDNKSVYSSSYNSVITSDNIFLLSCDDIAYLDNKDNWQRTNSTDYANCQGYNFNDTITYWLLRNPSSHCNSAQIGQNNNGGYVFVVKSSSDATVNYTYIGIRPALILNLEAIKHKHSFSDWNIINQPDCIDNGLKEKICECGEKVSEIIPATDNHIDSNNNGKCDVCGKSLTEGNPEQSNKTIFQKIGGFFQRIIDWFKGLFKKK